MLMTNYLKMPKKSHVLALLELGWSYRRIEAETGVRRETVSGYDRMRQANAAKTFPGSDPSPPTDSADPTGVARSNAAKTFAGSNAKPAKTFPGSGPPARFAAAGYHDAILEKRARGLTAQRVWQDLTEEFGYGHSYESVKRYLRTIAPRGRAVGVFESEPGQDYGETGVMLRAEEFAAKCLNLPPFGHAGLPIIPYRDSSQRSMSLGRRVRFAGRAGDPTRLSASR